MKRKELALRSEGRGTSVGKRERTPKKQNARLTLFPANRAIFGARLEGFEPPTQGLGNPCSIP